MRNKLRLTNYVVPCIYVTWHTWQQNVIKELKQKISKSCFIIWIIKVIYLNLHEFRPYFILPYNCQGELKQFKEKFLFPSNVCLFTMTIVLSIISGPSSSSLVGVCETMSDCHISYPSYWWDVTQHHDREMIVQVQDWSLTLSWTASITGGDIPGIRKLKMLPPSICVTMDYVSHGPSLAQPGRHMSQVESCPHSCLTSVSIAQAVVQQMKTKKNISELINEKILLFSLSFLAFKCHSCRLFKLYSPKCCI